MSSGQNANGAPKRAVFRSLSSYVEPVSAEHLTRHPQDDPHGRGDYVAGIGVTRPGDGKSGGTVRAASLISTSQPGRLQIRLVDPANGGLGACTGDSGAPVVQQQSGRTILVGVVSWSTGPNNTAGCGGLTGVTPLTLYRDWVVQTATGWGAGF